MLLVAAVLVGEPFAASPRERLKAKTAEARSVLDQVNALDRRFESAVEAWHGAQFRLNEAQHQLAVDRKNLRYAQKQDAIARKRVVARLLVLYRSGDDQSYVSILFGSTSVSEMLASVDAANAVVASDHRLAVEAHTARIRYTFAEQASAATERRRANELSLLTAERQRIGGMLAQRQRLLSSVRSQVAALQAAEAKQQAILAAQARARLAREALALQQERARAAAAEKARAAAQPTPAPATTTTTAHSSPPPAALSSPPPAPTVPAAPTTAGHPEAATIAMQYLGVPYLWGGATPDGFDCSGLVMYVYAQLGISLPHFAAAQYGFGEPVARDQLQPGDLVFFDGLNHVGIYIGGGQMIHAPHTGDVVKISPLSDFGAGYVGARRI